MSTNTGFSSAALLLVQAMSADDRELFHRTYLANYAPIPVPVVDVKDDTNVTVLLPRLDQMVPAIKAYRDLTGVSIGEAKDALEAARVPGVPIATGLTRERAQRWASVFAAHRISLYFV